MFGGALRILELSGSPQSMGEAHGGRLGPEIRSYLDDRLGLAGDPYWAGRTEERSRILEMAGEILDAHEAYSERLFEEMVAMAGRAGITPAEAVVVGGFTDLIDVVRSAGQEGLEEDDCTGVIDPDAGVLAQTWDMHASAGEYVYLFRLSPDSGPECLVQTTAGCLGQIGMNEAGIAVGINNLTSVGRAGVTWPFVVRRALSTTSLEDAVDAVLSAPVAGGHNFMLMGPDGKGYNIEAMPQHRDVTEVASGSFVHTNHCLSAETRVEEGVRNPLGAESSDRRLERGKSLGGDLQSFFADDEINRDAASPHDVATCGAVIMRPRERSMEAVWGRPGEHPWERFDFD